MIEGAAEFACRTIGTIVGTNACKCARAVGTPNLSQRLDLGKRFRVPSRRCAAGEELCVFGGICK